MFEYIKDNVARIEEQIRQAAERAGRRRGDIILVAVAKTFGNDISRAAIEAGMTDIGESRIQEAEPKITSLGGICTWHMIGHLQSNKAGKAVELFDMIQSVDSVGLAGKISSQAEKQNKNIDILVEVNSSGERQKFGFAFDEIPDSIEEIKIMPRINLRGLMTIGPWTDDEDEIRTAFRLTRRLCEDIKPVAGDNFDTLSMGMSGDFEMAIEEGSTMIRVGTAIFGERRKRE